ncbi:inverse autotransporter beta domain-containing protein, partial [Pantoea ananatis]
MPFYRQLGVSFSYQQYLGKRLTCLTAATVTITRRRSLGLSYTPVPLVTISASHKTSSAGESQISLASNSITAGVALSKQLDANNVAEARSLRG